MELWGVRRVSCCWGLMILGLLVFVCQMKGSEGIRFVIGKEECFSHKVEYEGDTLHFSFVVIKSDTPWSYGDEGVDLVNGEVDSGEGVRELVDGFWLIPFNVKRLGDNYSHLVVYLNFRMGNWKHGFGNRVILWAFLAMLMASWPALLVYGILVKGPDDEQIHDIRDKASEKFEFVVQKKGLYRFCFTNKSPYQETIDFDVHVGHFAYYDQHAKDEHFSPLLEQIAKLEESLYNIQFEQHWLEAQTDRQAIVNDAMSRRTVHKAMFESAALVGACALQVYLLQRLFEKKLGTSRV
ncbi:hypothetical protein CsatA_016251 [Cannabis sativa]